jgi:hypothetical protein
LTINGWNSSSFTFDYDTSCSSYLTEITAAVSAAKDAWESVTTSRVKISMGTLNSLPSAITTYVGSSATQSAPTGNPIIYCDSSFGTNSGLSAASIPGFAGGYNVTTSGKIQGALLVLNVQSGAAANITTLSSLANTILAHEIGHILGLGHSKDSQSLMYYSTNTSRGLYLTKDDADGVTYLYPRKELSGDSVFGCATTQIVGTAAKKWNAQRKTPSGVAVEFVLLCAFLYGAVRFGKKSSSFSDQVV